MFNRRANLVPLILIVALVGFAAAATMHLHEISKPQSDIFPDQRYEKGDLESADCSDHSLSGESLSRESMTGDDSSDYPRKTPRLLSPEALKSAVG